ncbi:hypothetical protein [Nocardia australiensis]|uniref:hypothetical protein n=1 Tax=Nocardia australiensis TaxID=2887191 RepID=UPI001D15DF9F|nr:hypothetical protein [Nocardia australiensis]
MSKSQSEIEDAARYVVAERLRTGVSTAYVLGVLERDPSWLDLPMEEYSRVRVVVADILAGMVAGIGTEHAA